MYIEPNTNIILLKNVPISNNYKDTLWFDSKTAQENYFKSLKLFDLKNYSYQRVNLGVTRVGIDAEKLYCCNYMMFQNASFGNKWFYAFVTKVEYVNNGMSHLYFEIDVMQTWLFDYTLKECFVEREHSATDKIGDNIVAENLGTSDYVVNKSSYKDFSDMQVYIYATGIPTEKEGEDGLPEIGLIGGQANINYGVLNGLTIYQRVLNNDNLEEINRIIDSYIDKGLEDSLILIQQMPYFCGRLSQTETPTEEFSFAMNSTTLDGYKPKNNKLFTYPYNMLVVSNHSGTSEQYQFELFSEPLVPKFTFYGVPLSSPIIDCVPNNYRNISKDYDTGIVLSNFPQCAWSGDAFKAWIVQNRASIMATGDNSFTNALSGLAQSLRSGFLGGMIGDAISAANPTPFNPMGLPGQAISAPNISDIGWARASVGANNSFMSGATGMVTTHNSLIGAIQDAHARPNSVHGKVQCDSLNVAIKKVGFTFYQMCVHKEHAISIDNFFTMYGYATKKVKIPNRNVRPHFTHTKTTDCTIIGELPADDNRKICAVYNKGITFWKNGANVGNYSLNNTPT